MRIVFAFDEFDGNVYTNNISGIGIGPEATFIKHIANKSRYNSEFEFSTVAESARYIGDPSVVCLYAFRFAIYPGHAQKAWFDGSLHAANFRSRILDLARQDHINLLVDHSWERLPIADVESLIDIFVRLGFPSHRLVIISSHPALSESANITARTGAVVMGHWFWESIMYDIQAQASAQESLVDEDIGNKVFFLSLNRVPRPHRIALGSFLMKRDYLKYGFFSFGGTGVMKADHLGSEAGWAKALITSDIPDFMDEDIDNFIRLGSVTLDRKFSSGEPLSTSPAMAMEGLDEMAKYYANSVLSIVTESNFGESISEVFLTEKIFKPILYLQPFIVVSAPGTLYELRKLGYETFSPVINEEYDTETKPGRRLTLILKEIERLGSLWKERPLEINQRLRETSSFNRRNFFESTPARVEQFIADFRERLARRAYRTKSAEQVDLLDKTTWALQINSPSVLSEDIPETVIRYQPSRVPWVSFDAGFYPWENSNGGRWCSSVGTIGLALGAGAWEVGLVFPTIDPARYPVIMGGNERISARYTQVADETIAFFTLRSTGTSVTKVTLHARGIFVPADQNSESQDGRILGIWVKDSILLGSISDSA